ncbi:hypothetical protein AAFP35_11050 [Gordonia sp. CPCC 206044]|uniref:hypothetical protein n=1 Tax=Gordonia sp. CPCC 206044 TaxID=3140793 RepID=UPI003AF3D717
MTHDDTTIPDITTAEDPIGCPDDLRQRWRALMGPLGFSESLLWFAFVDAEQCLVPALTQLPLPIRPDEFLTDVLMANMRETLDQVPGVSVAFLLTRPGHGGVTAADREWAALLDRDAARHGVAMLPVHRANDDDLVAMPIARDAVA